MKNQIMYLNDNEAMVTKAFAKNAVIFGTEEYKLWREYRKDFPEAKMVTKNIKKNPNKKTFKNLTYKNMKAYIESLESSEVILKEYEVVMTRARIQTSPYHYVVSWFEERCKGYESFFEEGVSEEAVA